MQGRILQFTNLDNSIYERADFDEFVSWYQRQLKIQLDLETNVCDKWNEFKIITIQFGSCEFKDRRQYVFQWSLLTAEQKEIIKELLEDESVEKLAHNAKFECIVLLFHGIRITHIYDTMLAEKVLTGGLESGEYALADISYKYLRIIMNKDEQQNFGDNIMTDSKILYSVTDVMYLDTIQRIQIQDGAQKNLLNVFALEMEVLPAFSIMTYEGMILDQDKWRENIRLAEPLVEAAYKALNEFLFKEPFHKYAVTQGYVSDRDRCIINFDSPQQRTELIQLLFPSLIGGTKPIIKKHIRDNGPNMSFNDMNLLQNYMEKNYDLMEGRLIDQHQDYLISKGYLIPANQVTINWGSPVQVLGILQCAFPKLASTGEEVLWDLNHDMPKQLLKYRESLKLVNDLGEEFIRKHVCTDGKVRTTINQIMSTGRCSSSKPNMQNIIVKEFVGTRYRNAFIPPEGFVYVSGDYVSQELVEIAYLSQEPAWIEALSKGQDIHSVLAEVVYGTKWKEAAQPDCAYYKMVINKDGILEQAKKKCDCKKHKPLRYDVKTVNFLLAYGGTEFKLAGELEIPLKEAKALIELYFSKLPRIKSLFKFLGEFTLQQGYSMTLAPFNRKRWFPYWRENRMYVDAHLQEIKYNKQLGEIQKAGMNHPIQGSASDITKTAMILVYNYIKTHNLWDKVKIVCQVHDQIDTICTTGFANEWRNILSALMEEAGKLVIQSGMLKADVQITPYWTK